MVSWLHRKNEAGDDVHACPECDAETDADLTYCRACGYDLVQQARISTENLKPGV